MAIANITTTLDNFVRRITNTQTITGTGGSAGTIDGETVVLTSTGSRLETGTSAGQVYITNSEIMLSQSSGNNTNDNDAVMNYGGRTVTTTVMSITDSIILARSYTTRHNIQVTELVRTKVIEGDSTGQLFCYTGTDAIIDDVIFRGINVWEIYAPPSVLFNVTVDDVDYAYLNWEAGRLDFFNFAVSNIGIAHAWMGTNNNGDNWSYQWNNDPSFDNQQMYLTDTNNRYYEGYTATWKFIDRFTGNPVEDVTIIFRDDRSGSSAAQGTFTTNSSGVMTGTYDSQNDTTGSDTTRPTLFMLTAQVTNVDELSGGAYDFPTSIIGGDQGNRQENYRIDTVSPELEIRSYLHEAPPGYGPASYFTPTEEIGSIASDLSVNRYQDFVLSTDDGVTASKTTADAYTTISDLERLFDRTKAEWYDNDEYPLPEKDGVKVDLKDVSLEIDDSAASAWAFSTVESTRGTVTEDLAWAESTTASISSSYSNRYLLVAVSNETSPLRNVSGITYGGVEMTLLRKASNRDSTAIGIEVWGLDEAGIATASSTTITVSWDTTPTYYHVFRAAYYDVSQLRPVDGMVTHVHNTTSITTLTMNPYVETSGLGIAFASNASAGSVTWETGPTEQLESTSSGHSLSVATRSPGASDGTISMDTTNNQNVGVAIGLRAAQGLITIDSGTALTSTSKFTTIKTTGSVNLTDTTTIDDLTFDGNLNLEVVKDLDNVTVTGGVLDFATAGTYAFNDVQIDEVTNSSGGSVTANVTGDSTITTNTGPNITIIYSVNVTVTVKNQSGNPIPGAEVAIFQDNAARTVVLASTATDENGEVTTTASASLGAIIIRTRQSAQTASFDSTSGINDGTEVITTDSTHNFRDGDAVVYSQNGGSEDVGLTDGTTYYVNNITSTTLSLHTTAAGAIADTSRIDLTGSGSETHLLDPVRYVATSATGSIGAGDFSATVTMVTDSIVTG